MGSVGIQKDHTQETHCSHRFWTSLFITKIMMSNSACLNTGLIFGALSKKGPIGRNPSSHFFQHSSQLIYILLFFKKLIRKKKVDTGLESRDVSTADVHRPDHPDRNGTPYRAVLDSIFCFIIVCGLFPLRDERVHTLVSS